MKREILFRAQLLDGKEWIEGYYYPAFKDDSEAFLLSKNDGIVYRVRPETVCQFTGIKIPIVNGTKDDFDENGNYKNIEYIFENDILEIKDKQIMSISCYKEYQPNLGDVFVVKYFESGFMLVPISRINSKEEIIFCEHKNISNYDFSNNRRSLIKIGNIYDNPELIK